VGPARPDATIVVKSCQMATITLTNYTVSPADADATFTVTANGKPWGATVVVGGGETPVTLAYTRPTGVTKPIGLQVLADGAVVESATLPVCAEVEAVVIPGAAPAAVEASVVAADTATLPATGAGSSAAVALAGAAMLAVGGLLVTWSLRRPDGPMAD
jgi:LPXTG-motif cell wall-anchored protein